MTVDFLEKILALDQKDLTSFPVHLGTRMGAKRCVCMAHEQAVHAQMVLHAGYWYAVNGFLQIMSSFPGVHLTRVASISYSSTAKKVAELCTRTTSSTSIFRLHTGIAKNCI